MPTPWSRTRSGTRTSQVDTGCLDVVLGEVMEATTGAFEGVRVLDLSDRLSAAFCARLFGDCGADVVLLEEGDGHPLRQAAPFADELPGPNRSLVHAYANLNKRSVHRADAASREQLLALADVIVVSANPPAADVQRQGARGAIVVNVTAHGDGGPMSSLPEDELSVYASSGWASINQFEGREPLKGPHNHPGYLAGVMAFNGAGAALLAKESGGTGQVVDVAETEVLGWMAAPSALGAEYGRALRMARRPGVMNGPVPVRDGYFSVTFSRPHFWTEAMRALGLDEFADNPEYLNPMTRRDHADELGPQIEERLMARDRWDLFDDLSSRRCTVGVVLDVADLISSTQLQERGTLATTVVDGREVTTLHAPAKLSATPWQVYRPAPDLGEHTADVLASWSTEGPQ